jgi:SAM-dependent methyltransferase
VFIAQGNATRLPFRDGVFDAVVNTYLVDRINTSHGPTRAITEMARVLKPGGVFILSDPLNFESTLAQRAIPDARALQKAIRASGIDISESFDGLLYREEKDVRGNYADYVTFVCIGRKKG